MKQKLLFFNFRKIAVFQCLLFVLICLSSCEKEEEEPTYLYGGAQFAQLDVASTETMGETFDIYFDGEFIGTLNHYFNSMNFCGSLDAVGSILESGNVYVEAIGNSSGIVRYATINVQAQQCNTAAINHFQIQSTGGGGSGGGGSNTGSLLVWTSSNHGCGYLDVYVDNSYKGQVTGYYSSGTPSCGAGSSVTVSNLSVGTHTVYAECEDGTAYWSISNVTIYEDGCTTYELY